MSNLALNDIAYRVAKHGRISRDEPCQEELDAIKARIAQLTSREANGDEKPVAFRIIDRYGRPYPWVDASLGDPETVVGESERVEYAYAHPAAHEAAKPNGEMVEVTKEDGNNYCLILSALGMEEEGDPVAEVRRLVDLEAAKPVEGMALVPVEPTPEIVAAAAIAAWPVASKADVEMAKKAAIIVLRSMTAAQPGITLDQVAATIATMAPAYRAMIAVARKGLSA
ncbi:hypothetical protein ABIE56_000967 [Luteibacter sp. 621]|uniref:hypothetical protein n=1 Tax=Luteibacter sp. 621 TaxID=3373916 RepID=UPI003D1F6D34